MGCQKKIVNKILLKNADYILAVKGNQGRFEEPYADTYSSQEKGHRRAGTRSSLVTQDTSVLGDIAFDRPELTTVGIAGSIHKVGDAVPQDIAIKYYISSAKLNAKELLEATRSH